MRSIQSSRSRAPRTLARTMVGGAIIALAACSGGAGYGYVPPPTVIYNSNPSPVPGNVVSQGFECCQVSEFGDQITFEPGTPRGLQQATVTMSDWAKKADWPSVGDAVGFDQALTLKIYAVNPGPTLGAVLASTTQTFHIPWRPAADPTNCPSNPTKFQSTPGAADTNCFNGLATQVSFDLSSLNVTAPDQVVWGVSYNTNTHGYAPTGVPGPYDSLNVGAEGTGATTGTDTNPAVAWLAGGSYPFCDGIASPSALRPDTGCPVGSDWTGYTPEIMFTAT